jgi:glycosyltransferase involved in cell wall biosynthesis
MMHIQYKRPAPSVTMVLVCYNQEKYIKEAVLSVLSQDYSDLKIIISDDCSKDKTVSIIEHMVDLMKFFLIRIL